ncbi:MipA/OmpV family protein [Asticcacaulis sp.]|uniref:MipA/OmpV family protein n=1 Tax=Asticcacaulis sp. TaxID=1872648 RepID=UPI0039195F7D
MITAPAMVTAPSVPVACVVATSDTTGASQRSSMSFERPEAVVPKGLSTLFGMRASGDVGVIWRRRPAHIGAVEAVSDLYPIVELRVGDRWQVSLDEGVRWTAAERGRWRVGPVLEYRQAYRDKLPRGARPLPDAVEFGGFSQWQTGFGDVELRLRRALNSYQGWSGDLSYDAGARLSSRTAIGVELRGAWADSRFSGPFLGLPPTRRASYFTLGSEVTLGHRLDERTTAFVQGSADRLYGDDWRRPALRSRHVFTLSLGFTRHFGAREADSLL